jgi:nuclear transport factor 2 (NTF2) superfamily protein
MARHGKNEQERWKQELNDIRAKCSEWIETVVDRKNSTPEEQIENLIDTLLRWQQLAISTFDVLEIAMEYVNESNMLHSDHGKYARAYSNAVHNFEEAGIDNHIKKGVKEHLIERFD